MRLAFVTHRALPQLSDDDRLAVHELRQRGVAIESAVWDSPLVDWARYDALVLRSPWDYHDRAHQFEGWLAHVEQLGVPLWNPAALVRWNMDKRYLVDLAERGIATVPTLVVERGSEMSLADVARDTGWETMVYKSAIGASGARLARVTPAERAAQETAFAELLAAHDMLVQPFLPSIEVAGEWSLIFISGRFSHAVRRRPREGDFRVQSDFGGTIATAAPTSVQLAEAERVVAQLPPPWLFARVDVVDGETGVELMELELLDPELFLAHHPSAARRFADAVRHLVAGRRTPPSFTPRSVTPPRGN